MIRNARLTKRGYHEEDQDGVPRKNGPREGRVADKAGLGRKLQKRGQGHALYPDSQQRQSQHHEGEYEECKDVPFHDQAGSLLAPGKKP